MVNLHGESWTPAELNVPTFGADPALNGGIIATRNLITARQGIFLAVGCSDHKSAGSIGLDKRNLEGVDIVHDVEVLPWPLPDACAYRILMSHIVEHLDPAKIVDIIDECWRIMKPQGQLLIAMPYAGSPRFWQDPTHKHAWNEATATYFDCMQPLWQVYRPQCWKIELNEWQSIGDIQVILSKRKGAHGSHDTP